MKKNYLNDDPEVCEFVQNRLYLTVGRVQKGTCEWKFNCPICGDSKKIRSKMRGSYYPKTNSFKCFNEGCSASGLFIIAKFENKDISEVKRDFLDSLNKALKANKNNTYSSFVNTFPFIVCFLYISNSFSSILIKSDTLYLSIPIVNISWAISFILLL